MDARAKTRLVWLVLAAAALSAKSQTAPAVSATMAGKLAGETFRQIVDPQSGEKWLVMRDAAHPGGPGKTVLVESAKTLGAKLEGPMADAQRRQVLAASASAESPVVRAGDALIVEENTVFVRARLEAVAVNSAVKGAELGARLKIGGRVVRVVAVAAGRAELLPKRGAQP